MVVFERKKSDRKKFRIFFDIGLFLFFLFLGTVFFKLNFVQAANTPDIITYQGKILNNGLAVTTTLNIKFVLYDNFSGGSILYTASGTIGTPQALSTQVNNGLFTINLGDTGTNTLDPSIFQNNQTVYLEVTVGSETLSPRKRITASPFAINSKYLDGVIASSSAPTSAYIPISDSNGNFNLNGVTSTAINVTGASTLATTTITSLNSTSGTISTLNSSDITASNLNVTNATFTNATTTGSFWTNLFTSLTGVFTHLFWTDATSTGNTNLNTLTTTGLTTLATTTISSSTAGYLNITNDTNVGGLLNVTGNSSFATITSGTWNGGIISSIYGGTGQDMSGWTGLLKVNGGIFSTSTVQLNGVGAEVNGTLSVINGGTGATSFDAGAIIFSDGTSLTQNSANLFWDNASSSLGIGTSSPKERLHVYNGTLLVDSPVNPTLKSSVSIGAVANGSYISGRYAYVAAGDLLIYDIANLSSTTLVADSASFATNTNAVAVAGNFAYVADNTNGLKILDVSNPSSPTENSVVSLGGNAFDVAVSGRYAYVADGSSGLKIVDISNANQPSLLSSVATSFAQGLYVAGKYVYLADWFGGLKIIDATDPSNPTIVSSTTDGAVYGVYVSGKYAFISKSLGITIYDISNPSSPQLIKTITTTGDPKAVYVSGKYLYFSEGTVNTLSIYDISDISNPFSVGTYTGSSVILNIKVVGKYAYLSDSTGFRVVDIQGAEISSANIGNIATNDLTVWENADFGNSLSVHSSLNVGSGGIMSNGPVSIDVNTSTGSQSVFSIDNHSTAPILDILNNGKVGIGTSTPSEKLQIYDGTLLVNNPATPVVAGTINDTTTLFTATGIDMSGKYAYVTSNQGHRLTVVDVSNPNAPLVVGSVKNDTDLNGAASVKISGRYAYVTSENGNSLTVVDVANPTTPVIVGYLSDGTNLSGAYGLSVSGKYAYVTGRIGNSLTRVNISNPASPVVAGTIFDAVNLNDPRDVVVYGNYAYVANGAGSGVSVVDISSFGDMTISGTVTSSVLNGAVKVYVSGKYAYVTASTTDSLVIVKISNPSSPNITGSVSSSIKLSSPSDVKVAGNYAYVTGQNGNSFTVIDITDKTAPNIIGLIHDHTLLGSPAGLVLSGKYAYVIDVNASLTTIDIEGADISSASIGDIFTNTLSVWDNSDFGNNLSIRNSLNVGVGGILSSGALAVMVSSTISTDTIFSVSTVSTSSILAITADGNVVIDQLSVSGNTSLATTTITSSTIGYLNVTNDTNIGGLLNVVGASTFNNSIMATGTTGGTPGSGAGTRLMWIPSKGAFRAGNINGTQWDDANIGNYSFAVGQNNTATGTGSIAIGQNSLAQSTVASIALGYAAQSLGNGSGIISIGNQTIANGNSGVVAIGDDAEASSTLGQGGVGMVALGYAAHVNSNKSIAIGSTLTVNGNNSTVIGDTLTVTGDNSTAVGRSIHVSGTNSIGLGSFFDISGNGSIGINAGLQSTTTISQDNVIVFMGGNVGFGTTTPNQQLVISGNAAVVATSTPASNAIFSVSSITTSSMLSVLGDGTVLINTSTVSNSSTYKLVVDAGASNAGGIGVNGFIQATGFITGTTTLDLAETYPINLSCNINNTCPKVGDVVCVDATVVAGVKKCSSSLTDQIIGIVSTNPGFLLGGGEFSDPTSQPGTVKVALAGRVPVKVSTANGAINPGDKLTISNIDGVTVKAVGEVPVVAIAMQAYGGSTVGSVISFVNLGWKNQLYQALTIDSNTSTINVGTDVTPYNLALSGELSMFNSVVNKLVFNATALFESRTNDSHAFIFNATNFGTSTDKYLLSLRSNNEPRFSVMSNGDVYTSGNIYAANAVFGTSTNPGDLAERVDIASDDVVEPGDVLVVDNNNPDTYKRSGEAYEQAVAGVVSTNPTIVVGNGKTEYTAVMAMVGRVPLKVSGENGNINRGDLLVTASTTGYAMKYDPKKDNNDKMVGVVGIALEPFAGDKGKIMALIRTGWVNSRYETISGLKDDIQRLATAQGILLGASSSTTNLNVGRNSNDQLTYNGGNLDLQGNVILNIASITGKNNLWSIDGSGHFVTRLNTSQGEKDMYALQSPTSEFVFSSSSQLISGEIKITFDQPTQEIIDPAAPLKVNVTLTSGEAHGIYVSEKNAQGFTVKELGNGQSNASFDWMVVAKRKEDSVGVVLSPVTQIDNAQADSNSILSNSNNTADVSSSSVVTSSAESVVATSSTSNLVQPVNTVSTVTGSSVGASTASPAISTNSLPVPAQVPDISSATTPTQSIDSPTSATDNETPVSSP